MEWDYHSAATTTAGVIPTLLLALVLEKQLLVSAVRVSGTFRHTVEAIPRWLRWVLRAINPGLDVETLPALLAPTALVVSAVIAEMVALVGVAVPRSSTQSGWGNVAAIVGLIFVGCAILLLLSQTAIGLIGIAREAETEGHEGSDGVV
jgi:hypothetical protein